MTVIGIDDTDSRETGMCTTFLAARLADLIREQATVHRVLLVRLNPGVPEKTRGNAALAIHTDLDPDRALSLGASELEDAAQVADPDTQPGLVVAADRPNDVPRSIRTFAREAMVDFHSLDDALSLIDAHDYRAVGLKEGRGRIGALAAIGAWPVLEDWTYELITYRAADRWGTPRQVDRDSVFAAAADGYPRAWDTVDRIEEEAVCVPHTPGPVLYGVRGDDAAAVRSVAAAIESEPAAAEQLFLTNQGTDAHLRPARLAAVRDGRAYRVTGTVATPPDTRPGGHVFFTIQDDDAALDCVAFEPTKRFREHVRHLRVGDRITACGEVQDGTLKLEKFAVRDLVRTERVTPPCPACDRTMESAGSNQGYRCRACGTHRDGKIERTVTRALEPGWYEVPPAARRHIAKPLIRGGYDAPVHPER